MGRKQNKHCHDQHVKLHTSREKKTHIKGFKLDKEKKAKGIAVAHSLVPFKYSFVSPTNLN